MDNRRASLPQLSAVNPETWMRNAGFIYEIADLFTPSLSLSSSSSTPSSSPLSLPSAAPAVSVAKDDATNPGSSSASDEADHKSEKGTLAKRTRYQCELCFKCFTRPSSLATHMHTHTGEKPHQCTFPGCGKRFSVRSNLRRHSKLHEDPMPRNHRKGNHKNFFNTGYHPYAQHMVHFPALPPHMLPPMFPCQIAAGDYSLFPAHRMMPLPPSLFPPSYIVGPIANTTPQITQQQQSQPRLLLPPLPSNVDLL